MFAGLRIRELRKEQGLTQDDLANLSGIRRTDLSKIENDKLSIGQERLGRIASALGVDPAEFADGDGAISAGRLEAFEAAVAQMLDGQREALTGQLETQLEIRELFASIREMLDERLPARTAKRRKTS